jgi:hypothetical protein
MFVSVRRPYAAALVLSGTIAVLAVIGNALRERLGDVPPTESTTIEASAPSGPSYNYAALRRNIIYGKADLGEVRRALTENDPAALSNTVHALYAMRWHRGAVHVLNGMWSLDKQKYPELAWELIAKPPVRIAIASTINRMKIVKTEPYQDYIRSHQHDPHEFNRAQVSVGLGFNGDSQDLPYLREMADGDNHYVAQSAITALSIFGGDKARDVLRELAQKYRGSPRGNLMRELLREAYGWPPLGGSGAGDPET